MASWQQRQNELIFSIDATAEQIRMSYETGLNSEVLVERQNAMLDLELHDLREHILICLLVILTILWCAVGFCCVSIVTSCHAFQDAGSGKQPGTPGTLSGLLREARLNKELQTTSNQGEAVPAWLGQRQGVLQATAPGKRCTWCGIAPRLGMSGHG